MPDVFLSYNREDQATARRFAEAFEAAGLDVWWDVTLKSGEAYDEVTERALEDAGAVVVLWSKKSVVSRWVRAEATQADRQGTLVPVMIEPCKRPIMFELTQTADLGHWDGAPTDGAWRAFLADVRRFVEAKGGKAPTAVAPSPAPAAREPLLAVLAFDNLSGDPEVTYFSDGVSEEILDTVARGSSLKVIGRSSSFQFRGADKAAGRVASALRATHVLDGSVRRAGPRVRISAHLVDCASETMLWSDRFERELTDVFALQDEIAGAVASALKVALARATRPSVIRPETYEAYLHALAAAARWLGQGVLFWADDPVIETLEQVVADAPTFAAAWENLAYFRVARLRREPFGTGFGEARAAAVDAAETALGLDPSRGRAWLALALLQPWGEHAARGELLDRALAANSSDVLVLGWRMRDLGMVGRAGASLKAAQENLALDPLDRARRTDVANSLGYLGRYDEALAICDTLADEPTRFPFLTALFYAAAAHDWARFDRYWALAPAGQALITKGDDEFRRYLFNMRNGDRPAMAAAWETYRAVLRDTGTIPLNALTEMAHYGLRDAAYELAEGASFEHMFRPDGGRPAGAYTPAIIFWPSRAGGLPGDPRFLRLCAKLGLVSYWLSTDQWPDCADEVPYDFRAEARKVAAEGPARHA